MADVEHVQSLEGDTPVPRALISQCAPHVCFVEVIRSIVPEDQQFLDGGG